MKNTLIDYYTFTHIHIKHTINQTHDNQLKRALNFPPKRLAIAVNGGFTST